MTYKEIFRIYDNFKNKFEDPFYNTTIKWGFAL